MSPEEAQLLAARLNSGTIGEAVGPALSQADAFRQRVLGSPTTQAVIDRGERLIGVGGQYSQTLNAGPALAGYGLNKALGTDDGKPSRTDGGPYDLSKKAQDRLRIDSAGNDVSPMNTPLADVQAAPTLSSQPTPKAAGGVGGLGGGGALKADFEADRKAGLLTLEQERELTGELGADRAGKVMGVAELQELEAARQQRLAEDQMRVDQEAATKHEAFLARNLELADEIGKMKTDPGRLMRNADAGTRMNVMVGGILGGALAGLTGGSNQSLARLDRMIDQDIRSQELEIDNKKASLSARNSVFGQMLQETGDRRLAAQQTRVMMLEAAKLKIQSDADRLGIPEMRTNAELATNQIQQKIDTAKTAMAKEAYDAFRQQAAAAAAAQRAAEEKAWQRSMEVAKLGLERDKLNVEAAKAGKESGKEDAAAIAEATKRLADDDVVKNKSLIEGLGRKVDPKTGDIVGLSRWDEFRRKIAPEAGNGLYAATPHAMLLNKAIGLNDQERIANQEFEQLRLLYQNKVTGSGGSAEQMAEIKAAFRGANTMAEKRRAIQLAQDDLKTREGYAWANLNDQQKALLQQRLAREGQTPLPDSVKVKK